MTPLVSVVMTAYRHERFLAKALSSVLEQRAPFDFEIVVGVDAAEDRTAEIARSFAAASPAVVRVLEHPQRVGLFRNFDASYSLARGRIIALLEGDDFWCSPGKLARQVAILESDHGLALSGHVTLRVDSDGVALGRIPDRGYPATFEGGDFLERSCDFHTSSLVFPEPFGRAIPRAVLDERTRAFDLALKILLASRGRVAFVDEALSAYRVVPGSASSSFDAEKPAWIRAMILSLQNMRCLLEAPHRSILLRHEARLELALATDSALKSSQRVSSFARSSRLAPGPALRLLFDSVTRAPRKALRRFKPSSR